MDGSLSLLACDTAIHGGLAESNELFVNAQLLEQGEDVTADHERRS